MATDKFNFTKSLAELAEITAWFESDQVDLDQALAKFERGLELATQLKAHLAGVENRVEQIKQKFHIKSATEAPEEPEDLELFDQP